MIPGEIGDRDLVCGCAHFLTQLIVREQEINRLGKPGDIVCLDDDCPFTNLQWFSVLFMLDRVSRGECTWAV